MEEYFNKEKIKELNFDRRMDFEQLAIMRLENGIQYNNLEYIFCMFCLSCADLDEKEGIKIITDFGNLIGIDQKDIEGQIKAYIKNHSYYMISNENPYRYSNEGLIKRLRITDEELNILKSFSTREKEFYHRKRTVKKHIVKDKTDNDILEKQNDSEDFLDTYWSEEKQKEDEEIIKSITEEEFFSGPQPIDDEECPFDMD